MDMFGGSIYQNIVLCQCRWTGIQCISTLFWGVHLPKYSSLPMLVDWYSRHLYPLLGGSICPKYSSLPMLVDWYSRHLYCITQGGPYAKVYLSAKFSLLVVKAYMLYNLYESFYAHCFCCCCSVCYCCPCVIIYTKQQQHEIIRRRRTTTKT